jgi:hypothetical protein
MPGVSDTIECFNATGGKIANGLVVVEIGVIHGRER